MKGHFFTSLLSVIVLTSSFSAHAEARRFRTVAINEETTENASEESEAAVSKPRRKQKQQAVSSKSNDDYWFVRIQQLPLLGMAAVSDNGVLDVELMKVLNKNFHIGPTAVYHFGKQGDTKMQSYNLGLRADLLVGDFGNITDIYISSAVMLGRYETRTKKYETNPETKQETLRCDYEAKGMHRVGAFAVGKFWNLSDSLHVTTGLGAVKTKTTGSVDSKTTGQCERSVTESDGTTLPWFDFGVGFRL